MYELSEIYKAIIVVGGIVLIASNFLTSIDKAYDIWKKRNPSTDINNRLDKHEEKLSKHDKQIEEISDELHSQLKKYADDRHIMLRCLSILIQNAGGDVDIEEIHDVNKELRNYLIK